MHKFVLFALLLASGLPAVALAEAGFAKQSIFLSKSSVTEGETVLIHAVVSNDAIDAFAGELVLADKEKIGTVPVSLSAGEAQAVSVSWKPLKGSHTVTAELKAKDGKTVEKESATFYIKPKPVASAANAALANQANQNAAVGSSQSIQEGIADFSPKAAETAEPAFRMIDSARERAADFLDRQIAKAKSEVEKRPGLVEGIQTENLPNSFDWLWTIIYTVWLYICTILRFIVGYAGVFYPVFAIAFLYLLWKIFRSFRRA